MDILSVIGKILIALSVLGAGVTIIGYFWLRRNPDVRTFQDFIARITGISQRPSDEVLAGKIAKSDRVGLDAPMTDRLQAVEATQSVTLDDQEQTVRAAVTWKEYWQAIEGQGSFVQKPHGFDLKMLILDRTVILKMRAREGGKPIWLKSSKVVGVKLMTFFIGPKNGTSGPTRVFRNNGQETPVPFHFPGVSGCPNGTWSITDIGRLKAVEVTGRTDYVEEDDYFPFVLTRQGTNENFGEGWCVYLDPRPDLAQGSGGLFVCEEFVPEKEVESLL